MHPRCAPLLLLLLSPLHAQGVIRPVTLNNLPTLGPAVLHLDAQGHVITAIGQYELRPLGSGTYRTVLTVTRTGLIDSHIIAGTLDLATATPTWTPNLDLEPLMRGNATPDERQGSLSADGRVFVWDNYAGATWPNVPVARHTFVCRRSSTAVPFAAADVRAIAGVPPGGADPHIGAEFANGHVLLFFLDGNGNIAKGDLDPATGVLTNASLAVSQSAHPNQNGAYSPFVHRDSTGAPRALSYSEYYGTDPNDWSSGWWSEGIANDGTPTILANGQPVGACYSYAAVIGGTWIWATETSTFGDPSRLEACAVANTDLRSGAGRIVAFAPIRPGSAGPAFFSLCAIGATVPAYPLPPITGSLLVQPVVGLTTLQAHDADAGRAEWVFAGLPNGLGGPYAMQVITLDVASNRILAGNVATLLVP